MAVFLRWLWLRGRIYLYVDTYGVNPRADGVWHYFRPSGYARGLDKLVNFNGCPRGILFVRRIPMDF